MRVRMLAIVTLAAWLPPLAAVVEDAPGEPAPPAKAEPLPETDGPYTGLVIDCRGLGCRRARAPKIVLADGTEVWGSVSIDPRVLDELGLVGYLTTIDEARNPTLSRAGDNPLFLRAESLAGHFKANPVISDADGERVAAEQEQTGFLDGLVVVFLVDAPRR